jgi:hypothetical protein
MAMPNPIITMTMVANRIEMEDLLALISTHQATGE